MVQARSQAFPQDWQGDNQNGITPADWADSGSDGSSVADPVSLSSTEGTVLRFLSDFRVVTPSFLAVRALLPSTDVSQALETLVSKGYAVNADVKMRAELDEPLFSISDEGRKLIQRYWVER